MSVTESIGLPPTINDSCSFTIFQEPWWLDAVAPGAWDEVVVRRDDRVMARLPFVRKKRYGLAILTQPPLTQSLGPWFRQSSENHTARLAEEKELWNELISLLPSFDLFRQHLSPQITNCLPAYWRGFRETSRYTYRITDLSDLDRVWSGFRKSTRWEIRKAAKKVVVRDDLGIDLLHRAIEQTFARQNLMNPLSAQLLGRLENAAGQRSCKRLLFAQDDSGRVHSALMLVWDSRCAYYLVGGSDPNLRNSGAASLLVWEAIKLAATVTREFDFEGSMIEPVEQFIRSFGASQLVYPSLTKMSQRMRVVAGIAEAVCAALNRESLFS